MAYRNQRTWWLEGPAKPAGCSGLGQVVASMATATSGTCSDGTAPGMMGCDDGSIPTCPSGYTFNGLQCSQVNLQIGNPLLPVGSSATIISGISNTYIYIGAALLFGLVLLGKK